jgi:hypothetical protein
MQQPGTLALAQIEVRLALADPFQTKLVRLFITLRARRPNGWAFLGVQHPELQTGHIRRLTYLTAKRIDLPRQVSLGQTPDRRIARHLPYRVGIDGEQHGLAAHASGGQRSLDPGMTGTDHYHIVFLWINKHGPFCVPNSSFQDLVHMLKSLVVSAFTYVFNNLSPSTSQATLN